MIPDLLAVRALLKKLLPLAFFQDHCVFNSFLVLRFLGLLPSCFLLHSIVSITLIDPLTLHSMLILGQWTQLFKLFLNTPLASVEGNQHT